jgi:hypothetical protein
MTTFRRIGVFGYGEEHLIELNQITVVLFGYRTMNIAYLFAFYNNTLLNYLSVHFFVAVDLFRGAFCATAI